MEKNLKIIGGRPKVLNPKEFYITASFTKNEWEKINENAVRLGITKSEYVSKMTIIGKIIDTYSPAQKDLVLRLINISNNLNQLAKAANTAGFKQVVIEVDSLLLHVRKLIDLGR
ncbi:MAG: plasmid mobilization relaxosome protein MobC [Bacteroidota bacterium]